MSGTEGGQLLVTRASSLGSMLCCSLLVNFSVGSTGCGKYGISSSSFTDGSSLLAGTLGCLSKCIGKSRIERDLGSQHFLQVLLLGFAEWRAAT
jgi:hypothetical protein